MPVCTTTLSISGGTWQRALQRQAIVGLAGQQPGLIATLLPHQALREEPLGLQRDHVVESDTGVGLAVVAPASPAR